VTISAHFTLLGLYNDQTKIVDRPQLWDNYPWKIFSHWLSVSIFLHHLMLNKPTLSWSRKCVKLDRVVLQLRAFTSLFSSSTWGWELACGSGVYSDAHTPRYATVTRKRLLSWDALWCWTQQTRSRQHVVGVWQITRDGLNGIWRRAALREFSRIPFRERKRNKFIVHGVRLIEQRFI